MKNELFSQIRLQSIHALPHRAQVPDVPRPLSELWRADELSDFIGRIVRARRATAPVVVFLGSGVLQSGLQPYLIDLVNSGWFTHIAVTGAGNQYDVDAALCGATDIDDRLESNLANVGMWKEIGNTTHRALKEGFAVGRGYGESIADYLARHPEAFPYRDRSLVYRAYQEGVPYTVHTTIGLDEVHVHPEADFAVLGGTSGIDFKVFCHSIAHLEHGVFINFGSTVTGVEVFLKALSIARNLGYTVKDITTANFDVVQLGDYRKKVGYEDWDYYYRPRKNVVHRPTSLGGKGFHFEGEHQLTIPTLWMNLMTRMGDIHGPA